AHRAFDASFRAEMEARAVMLERLREALRTEAFQVHYQPKIAMATGEVAGAEALVRWSVEGVGNIPPDRFIPLAEQTGLISQLGRQVLRRAVFDAAGWRRDFGKDIPVAVNLSAHQLRDPDLVEMVAALLEESGLPASLLELEITESAVMEDVEAVIAIFERLTALGLSLSIDDFGTGYSSLSYLRRFRVAKMKIDRSFVVDLSTSADARAVAASIVGLGRGLGLKIVAEGIEDQDQFDRLARLGCDEAQGWLFSKALPLNAFTDFITRAAPRPDK
ncbi:MAG: putative bifunctional diguanylate cyclase/phosphodiesterase, partial [Elsteraceae bacterium]